MEPNEAIHVESLFSIKGKTAVITGGSRGIGLMIARGFLESGAKVYISSRKKDVCDAVAAELSKVGECVSVPADVSTLDGCKHLAQQIAASENKLHILVNNAGAIPGGTLLDIDERTWRRAWDLKVFGYINMCRAFYALMKARGSGVSST